MTMQTSCRTIARAGAALTLLAASLSAALADPSASAPAQGLRISHEIANYHQINSLGADLDTDDQLHPVTFVSPPYSFAGGRCDREVMAALLDGGAGALTGSRVATTDNEQWIGLVDGFAVGVVIVGTFGAAMDRVDHACVGGILSEVTDGREIGWSNSDGHEFQLTPLTSRRIGGGLCRDYQMTGTIAGRLERHYSTACKQPGGVWRRTAS